MTGPRRTAIPKKELPSITPTPKFRLRAPLKARLLLNGNPRIIVIVVPWYLSAGAYSVPVPGLRRRESSGLFCSCR